MRRRQKGFFTRRSAGDPRRALEIGLGTTLLIGTVVPIAVIGGGVYELLVASPVIPMWTLLLVLVLAAGWAWFCVVIGWRLVTGRERPGGGLLHPWFLYVAAFFFTWYGSGRSLIFGSEHAQMYYASSAEFLKMARDRRQKLSPQKRVQPPANRRLQQTARRPRIEKRDR